MNTTGSAAGAWFRGWAVEHWFRRQGRPRELKLCETLSLGERRFVAVIQFRNQRFLLGGTNTNIALLAKLPLENTRVEER